MQAQAAPAFSYGGRIPQAPIISINLSHAVLDRLALTVQTEYQSFSRRSLEVGGFLFGRTRKRRGSVLVEVDDFQPLECEHTVGPSYLLSADDRHQLEKRVRRQKLASGLSLIGFYRSNTRKEFAPTAEDVDVMSAYFSRPSMIFLLVHVIPNGPPTGAFFVWKKCKVPALERHLEFPFDSATLTAGSYEFCSNALPARATVKKKFGAGDSFPVLQLPRLHDIVGRLHRPQKLSATLTRAVGSRIWTVSRNLLRVLAGGSIPRVIQHLQKLLAADWAILTAMLFIGMVGGIIYQSLIRDATRGARPSDLPAASRSNSPRSLDSLRSNGKIPSR